VNAFSIAQEHVRAVEAGGWETACAVTGTKKREVTVAVRTSSAEWKGSLKEGAGTMKLASGAYEGPFTYASRFESGQGTNPEELIGAAHAGCFSMFWRPCSQMRALCPRVFTPLPRSLARRPDDRLDRAEDRGRGTQYH